MHHDFWPEHVNDDFVVYVRRYPATPLTEMRAHWRGADGQWATADDVDWAFDSTASGSTNASFSAPTPNEGEIAYMYGDSATGAIQVRHCDFFPGSPTNCLPGTVAIEPVVLGGMAYPLSQGTTLLARVPAWDTTWLDPGQSPQPWNSATVVRTFGILVALKDDPIPYPGTDALHIGVAVNPPLPHVWTIPTRAFNVRFSPSPGSNGHLRVAWVTPSTGRGHFADLSAGSIRIGLTSGPTSWVAPDGDDVAYVPSPQQIAIDTCTF